MGSPGAHIRDVFALDPTLRVDQEGAKSLLKARFTRLLATSSQSRLGKELKTHQLTVVENCCKMRMMKKSKKPPTQDGRTAQEAIFREGLVHFLEFAGWAQDFAARGEGLQAASDRLQPIHLAFLRRAKFLDRGVSFQRIRWDTGLPRYAISRAAAQLVERGLGTIRGTRTDKRWHGLVITDAGRERIERIDRSIAKRMRDVVGVLSDDSKRYFLFTVHLYNLTRLLPDPQTRFIVDRSDVDPHESADPEEMEVQKLMESIAAKARISMTDSLQSSIESVRW